jgi:hypothetical protein
MPPVLVAVADDPDHRPFLAVNQVGLKPAFLDAIDHVVDLCFRCVRKHVDDH